MKSKKAVKYVRTYTAWYGMLTRCRNQNQDNYRFYGGRGISFCARWAKFENFLKDMGEKPNDTELDRIDGNKNYSKKNCRWANKTDQSFNRRNCYKYRSHPNPEIDLIFKCVKKDPSVLNDLAEYLEIKKESVYMWVSRGRLPASRRKWILGFMKRRLRDVISE